MKIKGFDKDLKCGNTQFEIGGTYSIDSKELKINTNTVFHYCDNMGAVNFFYPLVNGSRYCEVLPLGEEITDGVSFGSNKIKIIREIEGKELRGLFGLKDGNSGMFNLGNKNSGDCNIGVKNSGFSNIGNYNSGECNLGNHNSGGFNVGTRNCGTCNFGYMNSGSFNSGDKNCGDWNLTEYSNGVFNTVEDDDVLIFNKRSGMSLKEFKSSEYFRALISVPFVLTERITPFEGGENSDLGKSLDGGFLKVYTYKGACENWWKKMSKKNKEIIMKIPNFDKDVFKEITGITCK